MVFRKGEYNPAQNMTESHRRNISLSKLAEKNPMWKGDKVQYDALHEWMRNHLPKKILCEICKMKPPYDIANISGKYLRDFSDWQRVCRTCHMISDKRMYNLRNQKEAT